MLGFGQFFVGAKLMLEGSLTTFINHRNVDAARESDPANLSNTTQETNNDDTLNGTSAHFTADVNLPAGRLPKEVVEFETGD